MEGSGNGGQKWARVTKCPFIKDGEEKNGALKISSEPQLRIQHNFSWEEYTVFKASVKNDSGGLRVVWGAYFGAMLMKVLVRTAHLEVPLNSSLNHLKGNVQKCKIICYLALGFYFFFF